MLISWGVSVSRLGEKGHVNAACLSSKGIYQTVVPREGASNKSYSINTIHAARGRVRGKAGKDSNRGLQVTGVYCITSSSSSHETQDRAMAQPTNAQLPQSTIHKNPYSGEMCFFWLPFIAHSSPEHRGLIGHTGEMTLRCPVFLALLCCLHGLQPVEKSIRKL